MSSFAENVPFAATRPRSNAWQGLSLLSLGIIVGVVLLERLPTLGFAYLNVDESAYLMIGHALRHGALPYVDIVDRKPVGLYLIYALADALFPDPIVGVRIFAIVCTCLSAWLIAEIGRRFLALSRPAATLAAVLFSCYAILYGGDAAQYNVFVMPFVAAGATIVFSILLSMPKGTAPSPLMLGAAGLLFGLAMQIKYTPAFEAIGFGILLMVAGWRARVPLGPYGQRALGGGLALMIAGGLAPTLIAAAFYWRIGHLDAFIFYNFTVNLGRTATDYPPSLLWLRIAEIAGIAAPLAIFAVRYGAMGRQDAQRFSAPLTWANVALGIWFVAALASALIQRQPYLHYFYAIVPPLAIWSAAALAGQKPAFDGAARGWIGALLALPLAGYAAGWSYEIADHGSAYLPRDIGRLLKAERVQSLYVFNYFGILYPLSGLETPTRYTLPTHLLRDLEAASFQFDAPAEVRRILASRPEVIAVVRPFAGNIAADRVGLLNAALASDYCTWRTYPAGRDTVYLYRYRGGDASRTCNSRD